MIEDPYLIAARWMARIVWGAIFIAVFVIAVSVAVGLF